MGERNALYSEIRLRGGLLFRSWKEWVRSSISSLRHLRLCVRLFLSAECRVPHPCRLRVRVLTFPLAATLDDASNDSALQPLRLRHSLDTSRKRCKMALRDPDPTLHSHCRPNRDVPQETEHERKNSHIFI